MTTFDIIYDEVNRLSDIEDVEDVKKLTEKEVADLFTYFNDTEKLPSVKKALTKSKNDKVKLIYLRNLLISEQPVVDSVPNNELLDKISYIYERMKEESETSSLSTLNSNKFQRFLTHTHLTVRSAGFSGKVSKGKDIPPYEWSDLAEDHKKQRGNIDSYLNQYLKPHLPSGIDIIDVANNKEFLSTHKGAALPFNVSGGTDIILVDNNCVKSKTLKVGVHAIIELKKQVVGKHSYQAILEMIAADIYVNDKVKVFGVLTDLNKFWNIFWLNQGNEIIIVPFENRRTALEVIGRMIKSSKPRISGIPTMDRMKFMDSQNLDESNDDIALLEDFYNDMNDNEVLKHKVKKAMYFLKDNPIFSSVLE